MIADVGLVVPRSTLEKSKQCILGMMSLTHLVTLLNIAARDVLNAGSMLKMA